MKTLRILYHMARADFRERTRRYSFLVMLGLVVWLGYAAAAGILELRVPPDYVGEVNSAWVGALVTMTVTMFLGWFGFYLVKGSVTRDYETGVGQIMATTPLSRPLYALGKWLSNFAVLSLMILILMVAGIVMVVLVGSAPLDPWALVAPLLFIAVPCVAIVAALAVLFETISWLRGGFGNIVYFFMFVICIIPAMEISTYQPLLDFAGIRLIGDAVQSAAKETYPGSSGGFAFSISPPAGNSITNGATPPRYFPYHGIEWNGGAILARFSFVVMALGIAMLASLFFDRFNPSRVLPARQEGDRSDAPDPAAGETTSAPEFHLTPLTGNPANFRFGGIFLAELKLLLKGHRWWWYVVPLGLIVAQCVADLEITRTLLAFSWLWPVLLLSGMGSREARHNTREIVFSAPRPVLHQLPATWLAAVTVIALLGSGALLRFLVAGEFTSILAWMAGALFIPSLALTSGVLTGNGKTFEVVYVVWLYIIVQKAPPLDFVGVAHGSPWYLYAVLTVALLVVTAFTRLRQLAAGNR